MSFKALDKREAGLYSPLALAFMGDSVYEQLVREKLILSANMPAGKLHSLTVKYVCCEFQSALCEKILPVLTEEESDIFRRGRNAGGITPPKHSSVREYRTATALECLFGYLYLTGRQERIEELFEIIWSGAEPATNN
ncbi:MAG: ribonuclease III [Oscillospiraceae bacterium]|nr:ribonuclease III [Oscillospiraceae bacterium]